ncbi:protein SPA1-RELATED 3-like isoform X2 [Carex littledalei]|uniref:Protein SPA1-RELATED 3-like isoform X2 n=1 Tax=Carex littledalei TaxID=544730 RepID=A0A833RIF9_9POAL|nr:protein SPA1-RELATED 3-like isoform X2 [Carex littledalei]
MEGTTELSNHDETVQSPTEPQVQLAKETQPPRNLHVESTSFPTDTMAPPINRDTDWSEHFPFLCTSKDAFMENPDDIVNLNPAQAENSRSHPEVIVEELTLKNYKSTANISAGSSSSSGEKPAMRKGLWGNFTRLAGSLSREITPSNRPVNRVVEGGNDVRPQFGTQRARNDVHPLFGPQRALQSTIRPQITSELTPIGARSAFKGKEIVHKGAIQKPLETSSDPSRKKCVKFDEKSLYGSGAFGPYNSNSQRGINLREFLKPKCPRISKSTKMQIFRQIVELLNASQSQGLALKDLRPSYFMILTRYQVKYIGGFIPQEMSSSAQMEESFSKKRYLDQKEQKGFDWFSRLKHQKVSDQGYVSISNNTGSDFRENTSIGADSCKFEERWYSSPEDQTEYVIPSSSNIYSLGVLLFELFSYFETWELHSAAMSDLRHRILPPNFLAENPKEAGFCLWLLHPDPASRPKARDILLCDLLTEIQEQTVSEQASTSFDEEERESEILMYFLTSLKEQKEKQAAKLASDLGCLQVDISQVERIHTSRTLTNDLLTNQSLPSWCEERLMRSMRHLEAGYYSVRSQLEISRERTATRSDSDVLKLRESYNIQREGNSNVTTEPADKLSGFFGDLCKYARYNKFEVRGCMKNSEILSSSNVICSLSFDRDEEYFATAGVSKKIKIFEFESLLNDNVDIHYPLIEMPSRAKLSCVCWNSYIKNYLASTDYDGVVQLWDATTGYGLTQFAEHRKRAWSVSFSQVDPTNLASGSDDGSVKIWSINERNTVDTIRSGPNVCCVQYSPYSSRLLAFGSSNYKVFCYDLRNTRLPWCTLSGHSKAVSYVRFLDSNTLVSASTDNTLKVWDLTRTTSNELSTDACQLTLSGHTNEKNFVGLSVHDGYITCGSETNEIYAYYKSFPMPITSHKFGSIDPITGRETSSDNSLFVSSVCWRGRSNMVVSANSSGSIKVLELV